MGYTIVPDYYVPKIKGRHYPELLHCIVYDRCNFDCTFCPKQYKKGRSTDYTLEEFESEILELMKKSNGFKFTGGEPTLNPRLMEDVSIVKKHGGIIFLDTNGSNPDVMEKLLKNKLIDVVGISLKGINETKASELTGANISKCWINVNRTLEILSRTDVDAILTFVVNDDMDVRSVVNTLKHYALSNNRLYLKINNYFLNAGGGDHFTPVDEDTLVDTVKESISDCPSLKGRVMVIKNKKAVSDGRYIVLL